MLIKLNEQLIEDIDRLLSTKYNEELNEAVRSEADSFILDFIDLNEKSRATLNDNYVYQASVGTGFNDIVSHHFTAKSREIGTNKIFSNVKLLFDNVCPVRPIREISSEHINGLMRVNGIILSVTPPHSIITKAHYQCTSCGEVYPVKQETTELIKPDKCVCKRKTFVLLESESEWDDFQQITLSENPEEVTAGVVPRTMKLHAVGRPLIDMGRPGDLVDVSCALVPVPVGRKSNRVFSWVLHVNYINVLSKDTYNVQLKDDDIYELLYLGTSPNIREILLKSIFPSIYGRREEKMGLILALFGGVDRKKTDINLRGTINVLMVGDPSTAKALDINTPIPTPDGWTTMKDIQVGDVIFDDMGRQCNVTVTTPIMYDHDVYEVVFDDDSVIKADAGHLWLTSTRASRVSKARAERRDKIRINDWRTQTHKRILDSVKTTIEIKRTLIRKDKSGERTNHAIKTAEPLNISNKKLPIPPYTLGAWLGDGVRHGGSITCSEPEILHNINEDGFETRQWKSAKIQYGILGLHKKLRLNNLIKNKHIPQEYLRGSANQRLALIQGLMDSDGTAFEDGNVAFSSTRLVLAKGLSELLHTFGIKHKISEKRTVLYGKDCGVCYLIHFTATLPMFRLKRKLERQNLKPRKRTMKRHIKQVNKIKSVPVKCIQVDSPTQLYLAGKSMIPTHNTRMLQAAITSAPKALYTSGKGSSGVGLTAAAVQDQFGWRLEAGAVVLADGGVCAIDEIDKMTDDDREKIHEAMSIQRVSIHKANIHTMLNARTSIIAAANPAKGRYDPTEYLIDNITLSPTILSRFDLVLIVRDEPDEEEDRAIADKIFDLEPDDELPILDTDTIKKYILYAKTLNPKLTSEAVNVLLNFYIPLRKQSASMINNPIAITVRQLEGLRRLTEASARMCLKEEATKEDAEIAIELMRATLERAMYDPISGKIDVGMFEGKAKTQEDTKRLIEKVLRENDGEMHIDALTDRMGEYGVPATELKKLLGKMLTTGSNIYRPRANVYSLLA